MSEKIPEALKKWYEERIHENHTSANSNPEIDVINLTWLLKAIGFKLDFMDFLIENLGACKEDAVSIEVKCNVSGMTARLSYPLDACVCPSKKEDNAFWEVQSTSPTGKGTVRKSSSSSLLPEMSENCTLVSKAILANLLKYYDDCLGKNEPKNEDKPVIRRVSIPDIFIDLNASGSQNMSLPRAINGQNDQEAQEITFTKESEDTAESTEEIPKRDLSPANSSIASICVEAGNVITSSPNDKEDHDQNIRERDANVVQALNEARSKIDQALMFMKFNVTQEISMSSSNVLLNTPNVPKRNVVTSPKSVRRSVTVSQITGHQASAQKVKQKEESKLARRASFGFKPMPGPIMGTSALSRSTSMRYDTPRPFRANGTPTSNIPKNSTIKGSTGSLSQISSSSSSMVSSSSGSTIGGIGSGKESVTGIKFLKPLPGNKKKIPVNAPSLIERFKMKNTVTPNKKK